MLNFKMDTKRAAIVCDVKRMRGAVHVLSRLADRPPVGCKKEEIEIELVEARRVLALVEQELQNL
jgi:hypothetical protein